MGMEDEWEHRHQMEMQYEIGFMEGKAQGGYEMTKKHYELIAEILVQAHTPKHHSVHEYNRWLSMVKRFALMLEADNPNFDRAKFLWACGAVNEDTAKFINVIKK